MGHHSLVYYAGLEPPPADANFSVEWGLMSISRNASRGDWQQFSFDAVEGAIYERAGNPDPSEAERICEEGTNLFKSKHAETLSILHSSFSQFKEPYLERLLNETQKLKVCVAGDFIRAWQPKGVMASRDTGAVLAGLKIPPHFQVLATVGALRSPAKACTELDRVVTGAASFLERLTKKKMRAERVGTNVFLGHGRSPVWRDLKDFLGDRLQLPWDEFNRVPVAGVTNIARLSEMLDSAAIAFVIMTAEDEQADGKLHARLNVIHEVGLFQGRLGFTKAIVLLEEGCEEFSNIQGFGQIRFPKGNVKAVSEDIRRVLEREGLIDV